MKETIIKVYQSLCLAQPTRVTRPNQETWQEKITLYNANLNLVMDNCPDWSQRIEMGQKIDLQKIYFDHSLVIRNTEKHNVRVAISLALYFGFHRNQEKFSFFLEKEILVGEEKIRVETSAVQNLSKISYYSQEKFAELLGNIESKCSSPIILMQNLFSKPWHQGVERTF